MKQVTRDLIREVIELHKNIGVDDYVYAVEECAELVKELMKDQRRIGSTDHIVEEACDNILATTILLYSMDISDDEIEMRMVQKLKRALNS